VADPPAPAPAPARAKTRERGLEPLDSQVRDTLEPAVTQALGAYLKGDADALRFVTAPGRRIGPVGGYSLDTVNSITERDPPPARAGFSRSRRRRRTPPGPPTCCGFELSLAFQGDRWLVETVNESGPR
jgi:hypothetical protein